MRILAAIMMFAVTIQVLFPCLDGIHIEPAHQVHGHAHPAVAGHSHAHSHAHAHEPGLAAGLQHNHDDDSGDHDHCSPFCTCACCGTTFQAAPGSPQLFSPAPTAAPQALAEVLSGSYRAKVWHPPQG